MYIKRLVLEGGSAAPPGDVKTLPAKPFIMSCERFAAD